MIHQFHQAHYRITDFSGYYLNLKYPKFD
ncbi:MULTISPECIES: hypothetical protein [Leuconostoc]